MKDEKILQDEILGDEELENIAGGICSEMADDSRFLNSLNGSCDRYGITKIYFSSSTREELEKAWATVGITTKMNNSLAGDRNKYFLEGKEITQEQARQHAMKFVGKQMSESDWNW